MCIAGCCEKVSNCFSDCRQWRHDDPIMFNSVITGIALWTIGFTVLTVCTFFVFNKPISKMTTTDLTFRLGVVTISVFFGVAKGYVWGSMIGNYLKQKCNNRIHPEFSPVLRQDDGSLNVATP